MQGVIRQYDYAVGDQASVRPPADNPPTNMLDIDELSATLKGAIKLDPKEVERRKIERAEEEIAKRRREEEWRDTHKNIHIPQIPIIVAPEEYKRCRECGEEKPYSEFNLDKSRLDGHDSLCRSCRAIRRKRYYLSK